MKTGKAAFGRLLAVSDLHVTHPENREVVERLRPESDSDWLIVCGDVSESIADFEWTLRLLGERFSTVLWTPGNHELWTTPDEESTLRGEARYRHLVEICRGFGVLTPEDPYAQWEGEDGPLKIAPIFVLYDYSFGINIAPTKEQSLALAHRAGVVCSDEFLLHPDPYESREDWCHARVQYTEERLESCGHGMPIVMVSHFPLTDDPTKVLLHPEFAQWCGTTRTADWHRRFRTAAVVYGHLHIPRTTWHDGVRFEEVSLGYPREWHRRGSQRAALRQIAPVPDTS
ncbi:MAG TPA: metallophosphoesterase [Solirubrobacteraceae bacterium]|nr:metallophosphoesterase [Solirubrobacteraceae bacterium]